MNATGKSDSSFLPEDWDFSAIPKERLDQAILYEYGRSCEWVVKIFRDWHQQKFTVSSASKELSEWSGLTVKEVLEKAKHCEAPWEVVEFIAKGPPGIDEKTYLYGLIDLNPMFPAPFLKSPVIQNVDADLESFMGFDPAQPGFRALEKHREFLRRHPSIKSNWDDPKFVNRMGKLGVRKFEIVLDLRWSKSRLKNEIGNWIDGLDDKGIVKFRVKKGQAAKPPWFRLKELSALRFSEHKFSRLRAIKHIDKYTAVKGPIEGHKLLPAYGSEGAWYSAVQNAKSFRDKLFPAPH
jgi:hypothetical protein